MPSISSRSDDLGNGYDGDSDDDDDTSFLSSTMASAMSTAFAAMERELGAPLSDDEGEGRSPAGRAGACGAASPGRDLRRIDAADADDDEEDGESKALLVGIERSIEGVRSILDAELAEFDDIERKEGRGEGLAESLVLSPEEDVSFSHVRRLDAEDAIHARAAITPVADAEFDGPPVDAEHATPHAGNGASALLLPELCGWTPSGIAYRRSGREKPGPDSGMARSPKPAADEESAIGSGGDTLALTDHEGATTDGGDTLTLAEEGAIVKPPPRKSKRAQVQARERQKRRRSVCSLLAIVFAVLSLFLATILTIGYLSLGLEGGGDQAARGVPASSSQSSPDRAEAEGGESPTSNSESDRSPDRSDASQFPYPKPAFRYEPFDELDFTSQNIARDDLGYTDVTWNTHGLAPVEGKSWKQLTTIERNGAALLGFDADVWDCFVHHYDGYSWDELADVAARAYRRLGWNRARWEGRAAADDVPSAESRRWDLLTDRERRAAATLCYFEDNWDGADMNPNPGYFPHPVPVFRYVPWDELDVVARYVAFLLLGYSEESWEDPGHADAVVELRAFADLDADQRAGALDLGFYTHTWDCFVNHYRSLDWASFQGDLRVAVETLGWDEATWTGTSDEVPASAVTLWADLTAEERAAATRLCYFEEIWDGALPVSQWYDYDEGRNTAVAPDGPLPEGINMHIFDETGYAGKSVKK